MNCAMNVWRGVCQNKHRWLGLWQRGFLAKRARAFALLAAVVLFASCEDDDGDDPLIATLQASWAGEGDAPFSVQLITEDGILTGFVVSTGESEYEATGDEWYVWDETDDDGEPVVYHVWVWQDVSGAGWYECEAVSLDEAEGDIDAVSVWVTAEASEDEQDEDGVEITMIAVLDLSGSCLAWWLNTDTVIFDVTDEDTEESTSYQITVSWTDEGFVYEVEE